MKRIIGCTLFLFIHFWAMGQTVDAPLSQKKMKKDLEIFKDIRRSANSGLYKYRSKAAIDSIYRWADQEVTQAKTYRDFYNLICKLTDFEGSTHNGTLLHKKMSKAMRAETQGYFPFSIKLIEDKMAVNLKEQKIPLGAEIQAINGEPTAAVLQNLYKYYTTDGDNLSGKAIGINYVFSRFYRYHYGLQDSFRIVYKVYEAKQSESITLPGVSYKTFAENVAARYSKPVDSVDYKDWAIDEMYTFEMLHDSIGCLTVNSFAIGGDAEDPKHLEYVAFLDSVFAALRAGAVKHLIVDVRRNGGGSDPNDLVTYSYLTRRNFQENKQGFISFGKVPLVRYIRVGIPFFAKPIARSIYSRRLRKMHSEERDGGFYQDSTSEDHLVRTPHPLAFSGKVYLLISPRVASAGSMFAAMAAGDPQTTVIGEETMGGYYGHNGHIPLSYRLPNSKIKTYFSIVNLEQDVLPRDNQLPKRGIMPDHPVRQSMDDFFGQVDAQMVYVLALIAGKE